MGMYTELDLKVAIKDDPVVVDVLKDLSEEVSMTVEDRLNHPFFKTSKCDMIGWCGSYYFDAKPYIQFKYDKIAKCWFLTTCFNLKNYDEEIEKFLDWLCPYILTEGYIGTYWYEEQEEPMNVYKENGKIKIGNLWNSFREDDISEYVEQNEDNKTLTFSEDIPFIRNIIEEKYGTLICSNYKLDELWKDFSNTYSAGFLGSEKSLIEEFGYWLESQEDLWLWKD